MDANRNALVVIGDSISTSSLDSALFLQLREVSKLTGLPLSGALNRAVENWLAIEAPVYLDRAKRAQDQNA